MLRTFGQLGRILHISICFGSSFLNFQSGRAASRSWQRFKMCHLFVAIFLMLLYTHYNPPRWLRRPEPRNSSRLHRGHNSWFATMLLQVLIEKLQTQRNLVTYGRRTGVNFSRWGKNEIVGVLWWFIRHK